jgi:hypothetical protein
MKGTSRRQKTKGLPHPDFLDKNSTLNTRRKYL